MTMAICEKLSKPTRAAVDGDAVPVAGFVDQLLTLGKKSTAALTDLQALRDAENRIQPEIVEALNDDQSDLAVAGDRLAGLRARRDIAVARRLRARERALLQIVADVKTACEAADAVRIDARKVALAAEAAWRKEIDAVYTLRADRDRAMQAPLPDSARLAWNTDGTATDLSWALGLLKSGIDPAAITEKRSRDTSVLVTGTKYTSTAMQQALTVASRFWAALAD